MRPFRRAVLLVAAASVPLWATGAPVAAQEQAGACQAEPMTPPLPAGLAATPVTFELTEAVGEVTTVQVLDAEAGLALADPADLPRAAMVSEGAAASPIGMSNENRRVTLWLSTAGVEPGTYRILLRGVDGDCAGAIEVEEG